MIVLETQRLILREFTAEDASLLLDLDQDPEVVRFVETGRVLTPEVVCNEILPRFLRTYRDHAGLGFFAAFERVSGDYIGWFHFRPGRENPDEVDLGYRLHRRFWGRGHATEGSRALVQRGFREFGVARVVAVALLANRASIRVMEKIGMLPVSAYEEHRALYHDKRAVKYALDKDRYLGELSSPTLAQPPEART
jgi:RimJ/RimL family protein N-acetyltransferase